MNERLADALDSWWWGGDSSNVSPGAQGSSAQQASSGPQKPSFSWWPWWGGSSSGNRASRPAPQQQRSQSGKARLARQRSTPANLDAAGKAKQARVPRAASTSKLQPGATAVQATAAAGSGAEAQQQAAAGGGEAVAAKKPLSSRQLKAAEGQSKAGSKLSINKQMSYQERRRLWQERWVAMQQELQTGLLALQQPNCELSNTVHQPAAYFLGVIEHTLPWCLQARARQGQSRAAGGGSSGGCAASPGCTQVQWS